MPDLMPLMPEHFRSSNLAYRLEVHPKGEHRGTDSGKLVVRHSEHRVTAAAANAPDAAAEGGLLVLREAARQRAALLRQGLRRFV